MTRCDAEFKKAVVLACCDALERHGFTRFKKENVDWPLVDGFHCWVGLNTGLYPDFVDINPFVGVHVVPIMKFYTALEGRKYARTTATYARHMGEFVPDVPAFQFTRAADVRSEADRLARLYATVGLEFAKAIADYDSLLPLLRERIDMHGAYPERYASCLYLMGRKAEARAFVEKFLALHRDYFEGFALPFLGMLEDEKGKNGSTARLK